MKVRRPTWWLDADRATVNVKRTNRKVRMTVAAKTDAKHVGRPNAATFAYVDLDADEVDRLVRRLQAVRGGKAVL